MEKLKSVALSVYLAFFGVPLLAHVVAFIVGFIAAFLALIIDATNAPAFMHYLVLSLTFILGGGAMFIVGQKWDQHGNPPWRQCLLLLPALIALGLWIVAMEQGELNFSSKPVMRLFWELLPWFLINITCVLSGWFWGIIVISAGSQILFAFGYLWQKRKNPLAATERLCRNTMLILLVLSGGYALWQGKLHADKYPGQDAEKSVKETIDTRDFRPDVADSALVTLQGEPALRFTQRWPRLDGATAAYPLYASAFYALNAFPAEMKDYEITSGYLDNSRTPQAYNNLIADRVDIIFVAQPSTSQKQRAQNEGVKLTYTPFAREAFVIIANKKNPVNSLTEQQVRDIFSGKVRRWDEVGGDQHNIQIWQRPVDSGSQTVMLAKVMKDTPMLPAQETEIATAMEGVIHKVAEYQNNLPAIGYTFRYYATKMNADKGIKLLAINGIAPTVENIRNGSYPYTVDVYMVTRERPTPETQKLVDWFLSPQGQRLVQDVGYVPLYNTQK